ncbi:MULTISPECIES: alpha/beta fold hydrolase [unclassified Streptomyces]|uniref:alpha/beta fold hydrolase n=1 Tax=unclassified Streptomyces TaxID=2593676 RepID=UPI002E2B9966|nr:alpha/beta hydrolase [Streptomyces sp. NBC_01429]
MRTGPAAERTVVRGADGVPLLVYAAGERHRPVVVIATACGMPVELTDPWIRALAADSFVVTWETRGIFAESALSPTEFDALGHDVAAQAGDLCAVLDHFKVERAHAMGFCGGAVIALRAAADQPGRLSSLSLWNGDFALPGHATTDHQRNLKAVMEMAARDRTTAAELLALLRQLVAGQVPPELADLVLYPYADAERFHRYCRLNGAIMAADLAALLPGIDVPALVVTAVTDTTTHPDGSRGAARLLSGSELCEAGQGSHLAVFEATRAHRALLESFRARHTS